MPFDVKANPSTNVFYKGSYPEWSGFTSQFPSTSAGLWIERSGGWSWYATMPLGSWARELLYVPITSPIFMYEIYPSGFVTRYNLGVVQPGYYYLWYYADTPGRHLDVFGIGNVYSNKIVIDVYTISVPKPVPPKPIRPDPKKECEKNPSCHWSDAYRQCLCTGILPEDSEKVKCEQRVNCKWANGQCDCFMPHPDDQEKKQCENTPNCHWANGQCLCTGLKPSEPEPQPTPMPEPVINPEPENGAQSNNVGAMPS